MACFNVCSGLLSTCSSYFHKQFGTVLGYRGWTIVFTLIALVIANIGLSAIIKLSVPVLEALYPIAIVLVLLSLLHGVFTRHFPAVYFWTVLFTAIDSVANGIANLVAAFGGRHCRTHAHALNRNGIPHSPAEALSRASSSPTKSP